MTSRVRRLACFARHPVAFDRDSLADCSETVKLESHEPQQVSRQEHKDHDSESELDHVLHKDS